MEEASATPAFGAVPRYPIESVDNALQLLSLVVTRERLRVKDAAEALGVAGGTAHRLLAMLQYRGYVTQDPVTKMYVPGSMLLSIGLRSAQNSDLRGIARRHLQALNERLDETIQLATLQDTWVFFIDAIESSKALKVSSRTGTRHLAHCTSVGKAMLAELPEARLLELYPSSRLPKATRHSVTSRRRLLDELEATRERGYATNSEELEDGIGSVGAVVRGGDGRAVAAVGAGAPTARLNADRLAQFAPLVIATATRISEDLAAAGPA